MLKTNVVVVNRRNLENNQIANVSSKAFEWTNELREIDISSNVLVTIPDAIGKLPLLQKLSVFKSLRSFKRILPSLKQLKLLGLLQFNIREPHR